MTCILKIPLAYININHHGVEKPTIVSSKITEGEKEIKVEYTTRIWNRELKKTLVIPVEESENGTK